MTRQSRRDERIVELTASIEGLRAALGYLVQQIAIGDFTDARGHKAKMLVAYANAAALVGPTRHLDPCCSSSETGGYLCILPVGHGGQCTARPDADVSWDKPAQADAPVAVSVKDIAADIMQGWNESFTCPVCETQDGEHDPRLPCGLLWEALKAKPPARDVPTKADWWRAVECLREHGRHFFADHLERLAAEEER